MPMYETGKLCFGDCVSGPQNGDWSDGTNSRLFFGNGACSILPVLASMGMGNMRLVFRKTCYH